MGVEELWASKSSGYKKVQLGTKKPVSLLRKVDSESCKNLNTIRNIENRLHFSQGKFLYRNDLSLSLPFGFGLSYFAFAPNTANYEELMGYENGTSSNCA